ncbi:hypothetical protein E2C01_065857 [Portunus trituberculatus]|uniref:Uncharacterized protein n=1 Tax=Portunus trituberculatus TaxID=210409 RepID=A0A5B7HSC1_PORTR|nr:hypothetical protein [Portunus trituberculatus]
MQCARREVLPTPHISIITASLPPAVLHVSHTCHILLLQLSLLKFPPYLFFITIQPLVSSLLFPPRCNSPLPAPNNYTLWFHSLCSTSLTVTTVTFVTLLLFIWPYLSMIYCIPYFVMSYLAHSFRYAQVDFSFLHVGAFTFTLLSLHFTTGSATHCCRSSYSSSILYHSPGTWCEMPRSSSPHCLTYADYFSSAHVSSASSFLLRDIQ